MIKQSLALTLIHSAHLYAFDTSTAVTTNAHLNHSVDFILASPKNGNPSISKRFGSKKVVHIGGQNRNTLALHKRAFDSGLIAAFQMACLGDEKDNSSINGSCLKEIVELNLMSFFRKQANIER
jgi:hypothetical protein